MSKEQWIRAHEEQMQCLFDESLSRAIVLAAGAVPSRAASDIATEAVDRYEAGYDKLSDDDVAEVTKEIAWDLDHPTADRAERLVRSAAQRGAEVTLARTDVEDLALLLAKHRRDKWSSQ